MPRKAAILLVGALIKAVQGVPKQSVVGSQRSEEKGYSMSWLHAATQLKQM
jgi:hypothetical protein